MNKWGCGIGNAFGRCQGCGKVFYYTWMIGTDHFPLKCEYCGEKGVLRIRPSEMTADDKITMHNRILEIESKGSPPSSASA